MDFRHQKIAIFPQKASLNPFDAEGMFSSMDKMWQSFRKDYITSAVRENGIFPHPRKDYKFSAMKPDLK